MKKLVQFLSIALFGTILIGCGGGSATSSISDKKAWKGAKLLETKNGDAHNPEIKFDDDGNAFVVWEQEDNGGISSIYANRYNSKKGWGGAVLLENSNGRAFYPKIDTNHNGNAFVVWQQKNPGFFSIYSNRYVSGSGWKQAVLVEQKSEDALDPKIAFISYGEAMAVWSQHDKNGNSYINANHYYLGSGWDKPVLLNANSGNHSYQSKIAADSSGNAIAVWIQGYSLYASRYTDSSGWSPIFSLENSNGDVEDIQIASDNDGNAFVIWNQRKQSHYGTTSIYVNRYSVGSGWSGAILLENSDKNAYNPQIAFDSDGNAIAVWKQYDKNGNCGIYASNYTLGDGWSKAVLIKGSNKGASNPHIALDNKGNAIAVWQQKDSSNHWSIYASRYVAGSGWGKITLLENGDGDAKNPKIDIDNNGNAIVVWEQTDSNGHWSIYANCLEKRD